MNTEHQHINIALLTAFDAQDRRTWSGTNYQIAQTLQKYCGNVSYIGPIPHKKEELLGRAIHKLSRVVLKKHFMYHHSFLLAKRYASVATQRLATQHFDIIVAPAGETEIAFLETDIPIVLVEDATYGLLHNYYQPYSHLLKRSIYEMNAIESLALEKASVLLCSSQWAAHSAIEQYGVDAHKVHAVPFGANFETPPPRDIVYQRQRAERCRLLFIGVEWERKGGDIALETLRKLEERGMPAELIICGCVPPQGVSHEHMKIIPFLNKNDEQQRQQLEQLYLTANFLLVPTRRECFGIVFCEANAFGLPVITTNTGGVSEVIQDGVNGFVLPYHARGDAYADVIATIYKNDEQYTKLMHTSRATFDERLNWDVWGKAVTPILLECAYRARKEQVVI